ncbi:hypothetical protein A5780_32205 [Nocardia sp. 852002-20019_SCH5090214]|uniref:Uncharacterized protein n=3 Tax=Nocardiaceae TaxID=85025 RepID=A0A231GUU6_9NOCA|nr:hypothetical protein A5780_32205 [Nocardia sp. 852002-20019_SCH5090214]OXR40338.1 hypothetical protein B7C42_07599 [Nocardia cerradoensis]PPJ01466.1 hypothetical protein C5E51_33530 [Nocardia nova]PPJ03245.1 hypothetical protein C5E44_34565 [Nocardia nova]PPJ19712.1 hypothetical protein C5F51_34815 [Nocardia nova]
MSTVLTDPSTLPVQPSPSGFRTTREYERCLYEGLFGGCFYEPRTRALTIRTHRVRAIMAPEDLAEVAAGRMHGYLPIVTLVHRSGPGVWVLLTRPPASGDDLLALARRAKTRSIVMVGPGAELALPTAGVSRRRWRGPVPTAATIVGDFPAYAEVIEALTHDV